MPSSLPHLFHYSACLPWALWPWEANPLMGKQSFIICILIFGYIPESDVNAFWTFHVSNAQYSQS